jgi:hypothetical protein
VAAQAEYAGERVEVLFLTGQPGAGKSAVAKEISELMWRSHEPHAVIDIDELCRCILPTHTVDFNRAIAIANLRGVWGNYAAAGVRRLILARIIESEEDLRQFGSVIPNAHITVCFLNAPQDVIYKRLTEREAGLSRDFLLRVAPRVREHMESLNLSAFHVNNEQGSLNAVAREILAHVDWPCPAES